MTSIDIRIRDYKPEDIAFCRDSFYKGAASASEFRGLDPNTVKPGLRERFNKFANFAEIAIACDVEHDEPLFGWIAYTNLENHSIIWWVYVKAGYRNFGFARSMIDSRLTCERIVYPFKSRVSDGFALALQATFNPFILEQFLDGEQNEDR